MSPGRPPPCESTNLPAGLEIGRSELMVVIVSVNVTAEQIAFHYPR